MEELDLPATVEVLNTGVRKKQRNDKSRQHLKNDKYKDKDPLLLDSVIRCQHKTTKSKFRCDTLKEADIVSNRALMYKNSGKVDQDIYLCRLISSYKPQRKSASSSVKPRPRLYSTNFYLFNKKKKAVRVCKTFFMKVFSLSRKRLNTICKTVYEGRIPKERRGGDRKEKKFSEKRKSVKKFINSLPAKESHYTRSKCKRIYLSCELNIKKLWKIYNSNIDDSLKVKQWFFRHIFHTKFNIGFYSPASDACTLCVLLDNKLKTEKDPQKKQHLRTEKRVHKLRANAFYELARKKENNVYSFCFDLQQVMPLPKTPIQDSFYARQISFYNLCIVDMEGKQPNFYCWTEDMAGRGSCEVGSILINHLNSLKDAILQKNIKSLHLFCDGCAGQNKNSHIINCLMYWLSKHSPENLKEILIVFPVRGHSFLPADRVFGRIEKDIRKKPVITLKEEYKTILSVHGNMHFLREQWQYYDIKSLEKHFKKLEGIRDLKRILLTKKIIKQRIECIIKTFQNYKFEDPAEQKAKNLMKPRSRFSSLTLPQKAVGHFVKSAKKKDVESLLIKQFGYEWKNNPELQWYVELLYGETEKTVENEDTSIEDEESCDCLEPDCGLHV